MEDQDLGNYHFGYISRSLGIHLTILKIGAVYN